MPFTWTAFYRDGGHAQQHRGDKLHLDTKVIQSIQLMDHTGRPFLEQLFEPQQRAIYHVLPHTPLTGQPCHMLGWQETLARNGRQISVQHICYASEDGRIIMAGRYDEGLPWFAEPRPVDDRIPDLTWVAYYEDGKIDPMVEPTTRSEISTEQLDRSRLLSMLVYGNGGLPWFEQYFDRGQRMIFRRRNFMAPGGLGPQDKRVVNMLGWQLTAESANGKPSNVQHIAYAIVDESIVMGGAFQSDHPWFHAPVYVPADSWEIGAPMPAAPSKGDV
jgi:hypothetical protein